jgi:hypothetical protein
LRKIWKEAFVVYFKAVSQNLLRETKKIKRPQKGSHTQYNSKLNKYDARVFSTQPVCV